jgi:membrane-associated protease RseP (regulator of RpoE activity)
MSFWATYWDVIVFYTLVIILLYLFRKKFEFQGIVALFKTQFGVRWMTETGKRHPVFWNRVGIVAIVIGFLGMVFIIGYLLWGLYALFFIPSAPPALSPVIPGVKIPGVPFTFPLWYTLAALFFAIIVHEAMHGVLASAYRIPIKSSGFAFLGPIPGAFVEPDEKTMTKRTRKQQLAILAGGPFANIVLALVALGLTFGFGALIALSVDSTGASYAAIEPGSAAANAGLPSNATITLIDGNTITDVGSLQSALATKKPGDAITLTASGAEYTATLGANPSDSSRPYLGVRDVSTRTERDEQVPFALYLTGIVAMTTAFWTYVISLGLGIANLMPIGPIDGGRMFLLTLEARYPKERARAIWTRASSVLLVLVLVLVFVPILRAVF